MSVQQVHITVIRSVLAPLVPTPALVTVDSHWPAMGEHAIVRMYFFTFEGCMTITFPKVRGMVGPMHPL